MTSRLTCCQLLNPSIQTAVLSALMRPSGYLLHDLTQYTMSNRTSDAMTNGENGYDSPKEDVVRVHVPDSPRLFHLYMEAGRTINIYDWFEAFAVSLEGEAYRHIHHTDHTEEMDTDVEKSKEEWRREVYARFMRSLHELDYLGLLRWTGRGTGKKGGECAAKVVWATAAQDDLV
jgi:origin recognition complex subunit 3